MSGISPTILYVYLLLSAKYSYCVHIREGLKKLFLRTFLQRDGVGGIF